ncbi:hypothetical protein T492DRAFT_1104223 [Pavlovales sp. CCMP2436]|nr:hypothetical protein T492DRAFT_1104223 [Pavlovales sp. CCMP2436]
MHLTSSLAMSIVRSYKRSWLLQKRPPGCPMTSRRTSTPRQTHPDRARQSTPIRLSLWPRQLQ